MAPSSSCVDSSRRPSRSETSPVAVGSAAACWSSSLAPAASPAATLASACLTRSSADTAAAFSGAFFLSLSLSLSAAAGLASTKARSQTRWVMRPPGDFGAPILGPRSHRVNGATIRFPMPESDDTLQALRAAIRSRGQVDTASEEQRFKFLAREYEEAVRKLVAQITEVVSAVPELKVALEDEKEPFTSPAFPGRSVDIRDQRVRITRGDDFMLFDPTAGALASAVGQVRLSSSRPIPFLMEKTLYLVR